MAPLRAAVVSTQPPLQGCQHLRDSWTLASGWFWWFTGLEKCVAMSDISNKPNGFLFTYLHLWPDQGLLPSPHSLTENWICFFSLWLELGEQSQHPREGSSRQGTAHEDILFFFHKHSSWCRYLGNKQSFCRQNITGLSLSWEQTVCLSSCKHTEDSHLVLPLQLTVI